MTDLGVGVRISALSAGRALAASAEPDWFEIDADELANDGYESERHLDRLARMCPLALSCTAISIGSADPVDRDYLAELAGVADRVDAAWVGTDLCWSSIGGARAFAPLPIPYDEPTLSYVAERVREVRRALARPLVLSNPTSYLSIAESTMTEAEFIARLVDQADCGVLLDLGRLSASFRNCGWSVEHYLGALPWERVLAVRLTGYDDLETHCLESRDAPLPEAVWELYAGVLSRAGLRSTAIDWRPPETDEATIETELAAARAYRRRAGSGEGA